MARLDKYLILFLTIALLPALASATIVYTNYNPSAANECCGMNQTINLTANMTCGIANSSYYLRDTTLSITGTSIERNGLKSWISLMGGMFLGDGGELTVFGNESARLPGGISANVSGADGVTPKTIFYVEGLTDTPELNMNKRPIINMENPSAASDAATKYYHDHNIINNSYLEATDLAAYYKSDTSDPITGDSIERDANNDQLAIYGGDGTAGSGAIISVMGKDYVPSPGSIYAYVSDAGGVGFASAFHILGGTDDPIVSVDNNNISDVLDPVVAQDAATKNYVDTRPAGGGVSDGWNVSYLLLSGARAMQGNLDMAQWRIWNLTTKLTSDTDAVNVSVFNANVSHTNETLMLNISQWFALKSSVPDTSNFVTLLNTSYILDSGYRIFRGTVDMGQWRITNLTTNTAVGSDAVNMTVKNQNDATQKSYVNTNNTIFYANDTVLFANDSARLKNGIARLSAVQMVYGTSATAITGLSFPVTAFETVQFDSLIRFGSMSTNGTSFSITIPSGAINASMFCPVVKTATPSTFNQSDIVASATVPWESCNLEANQRGWATIRGSVQTGSTAGTVQFNIMNRRASTLTVNASSWVQWHRMNSYTAGGL